MNKLTIEQCQDLVSMKIPHYRGQNGNVYHRDRESLLKSKPSDNDLELYSAAARRMFNAQFTGIPVYRIIADNNGEYIPKETTLKAIEMHSNQFKNEPKKSLQECKDELAKAINQYPFSSDPIYDNWEKYSDEMIREEAFYSLQKKSDEAAELYLQSNTSEFKRKIDELEKQIELLSNDDYINVQDQLPPAGQKCFFICKIAWKSKNNIRVFYDEMTSNEELLEYGLSANLLLENSDFLVAQHKNMDELCQEYVTHWKKSKPLPKI